MGVYASTDGGENFALTQAGSITEIKFDPSDTGTVYATLGGSATGGLLRSTAGGAAGSWTPIFKENRGRFSFAAVKLPNGRTRIYLADASGGPARERSRRAHVDGRGRDVDRHDR